jgi:hypothetical protein
VRDRSVGAALQTPYPPLRTPLIRLAEPKRALLLHSTALLLLLLSLEQYGAHSRILQLHLTSSLQLSIDVLAADKRRGSR